MHGFGKWNGSVRMRIIKHNMQRYDTCGDWFLVPTNADDDAVELQISISDTGDDDANFLLYKHELLEALLYLYKRDFTQAAVEAVDKWDKSFIEDDTSGGVDEPGADPECPCYAEHMMASALEHDIAAQLEMDWNYYTNLISNLEWQHE